MSASPGGVHAEPQFLGPQPVHRKNRRRIEGKATAADAAATACKTLPESVAGTELRQGDVGITVAGLEVAYIDLQSDTGAVVSSQEPVLLLRLSVTNHGAAPARYDMRDAATSGQQDTSKAQETDATYHRMREGADPAPVDKVNKTRR